MTAMTLALGQWIRSAPRDRAGDASPAAGHAIADTVACMVAGAADPGVDAVRRTLAAESGGAVTVVGGGGLSLAPAPAALANGTAAHALDYDDNFLPGYTHASAVLVPALLALAEARGASGADLVDAYVLGLDLHAVLGQWIGRSHYDAGWHATSTTGCIATAGACARLLRLDERRATAALSLGVSMASGAKVQFGSAAKPFHAGMAAQSAVMAACLAEHGLLGREDALEGERGFAALYGDGPRGDWQAWLERVKDTPVLTSHGLAPKLYPCCGSAHRILDGVLDLVGTHALPVERVARVDAVVGYGNQRNLCYPTPRQEMEARFSLQYCVAVALHLGKPRLSDFTPGAVARPEIRRTMERVHMSATAQGAEDAVPEGRLPHEVHITLDDGSVLSTQVLWPRGTLAHPFTEAEREAKFLDCCEGLLTPIGLEGLREALADVGGLEDVAALTRHLGFDAGCDAGERFSRRVA